MKTRRREVNLLHTHDELGTAVTEDFGLAALPRPQSTKIPSGRAAGAAASAFKARASTVGFERDLRCRLRRLAIGDRRNLAVDSLQSITLGPKL